LLKKYIPFLIFILSISHTNSVFAAKDKVLTMCVSHTKDNSIWRCLGMLKAGKVDIMSGLLDAPERREFAHLLVYGSLSKKSLYVNQNGPTITKFADLKGLKIAVLKGIKQFEKFDNAPDDYFEKVYVNDMVISTEFNELEKFQSSSNKGMKKMTVDLDDAALLFIALSKKSKIAHSAKKYQQLSEELYKNKEFQNVINDFKLAHPEHYAPAL
jgi:polar amino acid transport system substrate-binding protein